MHYLIAKSAKGWTIYTNEGGFPGAYIGCVKSRKEALQIARLLAGWQGSVSLEKDSLREAKARQKAAERALDDFNYVGSRHHY